MEEMIESASSITLETFFMLLVSMAKGQRNFVDLNPSQYIPKRI